MITDYGISTNLAESSRCPDRIVDPVLRLRDGVLRCCLVFPGSPFEQVHLLAPSVPGPQLVGRLVTMIICNAFVSQLLWFPKIRTNLTSLFVISIFINIRMWFQAITLDCRSSLSNDYIPYVCEYDVSSPTWAD